MAVKTPKLPLLAARSMHRVDILQVHIADPGRLEAARQAGVLPARAQAAAADNDPDAFPVRLRPVGHVRTVVRLAHVEWVPTTNATQLLCLLLEDGTVAIADVGKAAAAVVSEKRKFAPGELQLRQLCGPDGQAPGWRSLCAQGATIATRSLVVADAQALWGVPLTGGGARRRIFSLGEGQATQETFTALSSLRSGASGNISTSDVTAHLLVAATGRRVCLLDTAPTKGGSGGGADAQAALVLTWVHDLGHSDPPRLLTCAFAAPWVTGTAGVTAAPPGQAPTDRSWVITAVTCRRAAARTVQCVFSRPTEAAALQQKDTHGWASKLRECVLGARAVGLLTWMPSPIALHTRRHQAGDPFTLPPPVPIGSDAAADKPTDVADAWAVSDPHCCGFSAVPPLGNNAAGVVLACDRQGTLYATPVMHTRRGDGDVPPALALPAAMPLEQAAAQPRRSKGCALPVHAALLGGGDVVDTAPGVPHVFAADCLAAVTQSPWPLTRLEVAFQAARRATARVCANRVDPGAAAAADVAHWVPPLRDSALVTSALPAKEGFHRAKLPQAPAAAARAALDQVLGPAGHGASAGPLLTSSTGDLGTAMMMAPPTARALDVAEAALRGDARIVRAGHASTLLPSTLHPPHAAASEPGVGVVPFAGPHAAAVVACAAACAGWSDGDCSTSASVHDSAFYFQRGDDLPTALATALVPMPDWADADAMAELGRRTAPGANSAPQLALRPPPPVRPPPVYSSQVMAPPPPRLPASQSQGPASQGDGAGPSSQASQGGSQGPARPAKRRREGF
jgi:hypothetical protein